jgi:LuxR family transcriptional regulator, activator of tox operons
MELQFLGPETGIDLVAREMGTVISTIGTPHFEQSLLSMACNVTRCSHVTAFACSTASGISRVPRVMVAVDGGSTTVAHRLAATYIQHYWDLDPANTLPKEALRTGQRAMVRLRSHEITDSNYRRDCYRSVDLIDRVSLIKVLGNEVMRINFYRNASVGRFSGTELDLISALADLSMVAIEKHEALTAVSLQTDPYDRYCTRLALRAPHLSSRERQVCAQIVAGRRSAAIAHQLGLSINTVLSHRRRAYAKLNISSQNELCHMLLD